MAGTWTRKAVDSTVVSTALTEGSYSAEYLENTTYRKFAGAVVCEFEPIPDNLKGKRLTGASLRIYGFKERASTGTNVFARSKTTLASETWASAGLWDNKRWWFLAPLPQGDTPGWTSGELNPDAYETAPFSEFGDFDFFAIAPNAIGGESTSSQNYQYPFRLYSAKSDFVPEITYTYESDVVPAIENVSPASGFINEKVSNLLRWTIAKGDAWRAVTQKSALIEWKTVGSSTVNSITATGSTTSATIPANTFPASAQIQWRVTVTSTDDVVGTPSDWYTLTTVDATDMTATPAAPVSTYLDGSAPQVFLWNYAISTGSAPSGYRLQYSADSGSSWVTFSTGTGSATSATIPANTFPAGSILWRVSAANSDGVWSEWSAPAQIVVVAAPPAPSLSVDATTARPVFSWQSEGQVAWNLNLTDSSGAVIFDTGATYGAAKSYQSPEFLPNGNYTVTLTVVNQYGINSDPAVAGFSLNLPTLTPPTAEANASGESVVITASTEGFETLYVLRNGIPIGVMNGGEFTDFSALGVNLYTVRGVTADGNFADSEPVAAQVEVKGTVLTSTEDPQQMIRLWLRKGADTVRDSSLTLTSASTHYAGRSLPVVEFSEFVDENLQFAFSFVEMSKIQSLSALIKAGKTLLYRDHTGDRFFITVSSVSFDRDHIAQDFTISAQKVDFVEKISY